MTEDCKEEKKGSRGKEEKKVSRETSQNLSLFQVWPQESRTADGNRIFFLELLTAKTTAAVAAVALCPSLFNQIQYLGFGMMNLVFGILYIFSYL